MSCKELGVGAWSVQNTAPEGQSQSWEERKQQLRATLEKEKSSMDKGGHVYYYKCVSACVCVCVCVLKYGKLHEFVVSSLHRGHADLLFIVPILVYVLPKRALLWWV